MKLMTCLSDRCEGERKAPLERPCTEREPKKTHLSHRRPTMFHDNLPIIDLPIDADGLLLPPSLARVSKVSKVATSSANPTQKEGKGQDKKHDSLLGIVDTSIHATDSKSPRHPGAPATPRGKDFNSKRKNYPRSDTRTENHADSSNEGAGERVEKRFKSAGTPPIIDSKMRLYREIGALKRHTTVQTNYISNLEAQIKVFEQREVSQKMQMKALVDSHQQGIFFLSQVKRRLDEQWALYESQVKNFRDNEVALKKTIASLEQKLEQVGRNEQDEIHRKELNFLEQMQSTEYQNVVRTMSLEALGLRKELGDCKEELRRQQMLVEAYRLRILTAPPKEVKKHEPAGRSA